MPSLKASEPLAVTGADRRSARQMFHRQCSLNFTFLELHRRGQDMTSTQSQVQRREIDPELMGSATIVEAIDQKLEYYGPESPVFEKENMGFHMGWLWCNCVDEDGLNHVVA